MTWWVPVINNLFKDFYLNLYYRTGINLNNFRNHEIQINFFQKNLENGGHLVLEEAHSTHPVTFIYRK